MGQQQKNFNSFFFYLFQGTTAAMVRNYKSKEKPYKEIDIFWAQELVEKGAA